MPWLGVDGVELHYEERGAGPPIVFSHGLLWSAAMFDAEVAALSSRYRCIAYDHRGQGRSASSPTPYDMERLTDDAAALIEKLGAAPCHFVGLSMGGFVGMRLAARRPELLKTLTLIETAADKEPRLNVPKYRALALVARLVGLRPVAGAVMRIMFGATFLGDAARAPVRERMRGELLALDVPRVEAALRAVVDRQPIAPELARIKTPTLVLHGDEDRAIVMPRAEKMARAIAGAHLVVIPRAGHTSSVEAPEAVTRALGEFLEAHA
ncbi:MAG TPA: alpha/beta fold hydrolase [Polyangia bacterium]|jgi:pimeloyl-ACP methyl ester carboxylesterase